MQILTKFSFLILTCIIANSNLLASEIYEKKIVANEAELDSFIQWSQLAGENYRADIDIKDVGYSIIEKDHVQGKEVSAVVRLPRRNERIKGVPCLHDRNVDASIYLKDELFSARSAGFTGIKLEKCLYNFRSLAENNNGHLELSGLKDFSFDAGDSTFIFFKNRPGLYLERSNRLLIKNIKLKYSFNSTSVGRVKFEFGKKIFELESGAETESNNIFQLVEIDENGAWVLGGQRLILPPSLQPQIQKTSSSSFASDLFKTLSTNKRYFAIHYWYGGQALYLGGRSNFDSNEDIVFDNVSITNTPGIAVAVENLKRGFGFINSKIYSEKLGGSGGAVAWDGIHIAQGGGDIIINNNNISGMGDDAINISNHVHSVVGVNQSSGEIVAERYVDRLELGEEILFFSSAGHYLGVSRIVGLGSGDTIRTKRLKVADLPAHLMAGDSIRSAKRLASRFFIKNNYIHDCACHGLVVQIPNGVISDNLIKGTRASAIRLLTDLGKWHEGVGVFNVDVKNNVIISSGIDPVVDREWGAISVYGGILGNSPTNSNVKIYSNTVIDYKQKCIHVSNTLNFTEYENICSPN